MLVGCPKRVFNHLLESAASDVVDGEFVSSVEYWPTENVAAFIGKQS